jgi:transcriptional antiterminator RfaH
MSWYVIHTKPRQEFRAKENLENQNFEVFLPTIKVQKIIKQDLSIIEEPLFSRYLFIQLDQVISNWFPIRSTKGVHQILRFGLNVEPVQVPESLINHLKDLSVGIEPKALFNLGDTLEIINGPFRGLDGSFVELLTNPSGESRAFVLIDILGKLQKIQLSVKDLQKII